jgi:anaerobic selenocysteine-containing dehydrogenase
LLEIKGKNIREPFEEVYAAGLSPHLSEEKLCNEEGGKVIMEGSQSELRTRDMMMKQGMEKEKIWEDVWIATQCGRCYAACGIKVHRVNGVAVQIEGFPESVFGAEGGLCGKGLAGLQVLYDPNRINYPLKRTNPEKGLFVDPKWKRISWEEALDELCEKLQKYLAESPGAILYQLSVVRSVNFVNAFLPLMLFSGYLGRDIAEATSAAVWSTESIQSCGGGGMHCGAGAHTIAGLVHCSWSTAPDWRYGSYCIFFGSNKGFGSGHGASLMIRQAAEARERGMKLVVFDPICNFSGGKAKEWIPIIPGTDSAIILAMVNIILNELGLWDAVYLKTKTNGPYLVGPDMKYVRDTESRKPLVWDVTEGRAVTYDYRSIPDFETACTIDYALLGDYNVNGVKCQPAFQLIKEHVKKYTPELASEASTVPATTIRRIAIEWAQEARVGSTITLDGHNLPFRPVSAVIFRGGEGHENSFHTCFAVALLNQIVGAADVPGGALAWPARGLGYAGRKDPTGYRLCWSPFAGKDGFLETNNFGPVGLDEPSIGMMTLTDLFPLAHPPMEFIYRSRDRHEIWSKLGIKNQIKMIFSVGLNAITSIANPELMAEHLKSMEYIVAWELMNNEFTEGFADLVLPDVSYLEQSNIFEGGHTNYQYPPGLDDWCYHITQKAVEPMYERRDMVEVMWGVMERLGLGNMVRAFYQKSYGIEVKPDEPLTQELVADRALKAMFGDEHGWEWFQKHGFIRWPKKIEEAYWRYYVDARAPIYVEFMVDMGQKIDKILKDRDIDWDLRSQYTPLISWFPCSIHRTDQPEYDLICYSYRDSLHGGSACAEQPWIDEASRMNPYTYNITMNRDTAQKKGIKDGDIIEIESAEGRRVEGKVKLMEGQHPQTVGIAGIAGHWAKGQPIARDKGVNFDTLLELDRKHVDPVCHNLETAVRVKVRKVEIN